MTYTKVALAVKLLCHLLSTGDSRFVTAPQNSSPSV